MKPLVLFVLMILGTAAQAQACRAENCPLFVHVSIPEQLAYIYENGQPTQAFQISSGRDGFDTISYEGHPDGDRIYQGYTSKKFPGGNYIDEEGRALGNMPYAMFFQGGFALHGTPTGNWSKLGNEASHGCVRMYPDQAKILNEAIRNLGAKNVWFFIDRNRVAEVK